MRQLYYSLVATILWLSLLFNLEWLVDSFRLPPFLYVFIPLCSVLSVLVLGRYKLSMLWPLAIGVLAYAGLEFQFAYTQGGESLSSVTMGLAAVVVTILLSSLLGRRLAQLQRLLTNLMVGQADADDQSFERAQGALYREVRRARRHHHSLAVLAISTPKVPVNLVQAPLPAEPFSFRVVGDMQRDLVNRYVLARAALLLREQLDDTAVVTQRNDHFVVLLPETSRDDLQTIVAMLAVAAQDQLGVALNIGAATFPDQAITFEALVEQAEDEMVKLSALGTQATPPLAPMPAAMPAPAPATSESNSYHLGRASTETTKITPMG